MYVFFGLFVFVGFFFYSGQVNSNCLPLYNSFYNSPLKPWSILDTLYKTFEWRWTKHCQGLHPSPQRSSSTISGPEGKDGHLSLCTVPQGSELSLKCLHGLGKGLWTALFKSETVYSELKLSGFIIYRFLIFKIYVIRTWVHLHSKKMVKLNLCGMSE